MFNLMFIIIQIIFNKKTIGCAVSNPLTSVETLDSPKVENFVLFTHKEIREMAKEILINIKSESNRFENHEFKSYNIFFKDNVLRKLYLEFLLKIKKNCGFFVMKNLHDKDSRKFFRKQMIACLILFLRENDYFDNIFYEKKLECYIVKNLQLLNSNSKINKPSKNLKKYIEKKAIRKIIRTMMFQKKIGFNLKNLVIEKKFFLDDINEYNSDIFNYFFKLYNLQKENLDIDFKHISKLHAKCFDEFTKCQWDANECYFAFDLINYKCFSPITSIYYYYQFERILQTFYPKNYKNTLNYDVIIFNSFCTLFIGKFGFFILFEDNFFREGITFFTQFLSSRLNIYLTKTHDDAKKGALDIFEQVVEVIFPDLVANFKIIDNNSINLDIKIEETEIYKKKI